MKSIKLNKDLYTQAARRYYNWELPSQDINELLLASQVQYYGGKCPVYYILLQLKQGRMVIGGRYATNQKPRLVAGEVLDFD